MEASYDPYDRIGALRRASEAEKLPMGIFYLNPKPSFEEKLSVYQESRDPLYKRSPDLSKLSEWIYAKRGI